MPVDPKASLWPGSGRTLYSLGQKATRASLEEVAAELALINRGEQPADARRGGSWWERLLTRGKEDGTDDLVPKV